MKSDIFASVIITEYNVNPDIAIHNSIVKLICLVDSTEQYGILHLSKIAILQAQNNANTNITKGTLSIAGSITFCLSHINAIHFGGLFEIASINLRKPFISKLETSDRYRNSVISITIKHPNNIPTNNSSNLTNNYIATVK